ncbi:type VI secretion system protein TssL, short form [Mangrovibacter plantisponsor]|uniref:Type VI secretion system protein ImpK n=1 Tax=Mangrovibacter plantisponsor TaxID=451513 RepID=A0A317PZ30_9ENTR|nr:type VI secretion system protein TssL, short form [Mangrovibacter plantisponsor]PWW07972.1 type VI secretion system protein ImpK [Mangrovibacter plantisponsor]
MSEQIFEVTKPVDIDALLHSIWLQVISLRHSPEFKSGEGAILWERCVENITGAQQALQATQLDEVSCQHILTAQCALLDETVKSRGVQDDACVQWYSIPLEGHFLGTMNAGDTLCDRMRAVLREPAPDPAVLVCFHRVLMLGFLGSYRSLDDPERNKLVNALNDRVGGITCSTAQPVLDERFNDVGVMRCFSSWPARIGLAVFMLVVLWLGLDLWLDLVLATRLPEVAQ